MIGFTEHHILIVRPRAAVVRVDMEPDRIVIEIGISNRSEIGDSVHFLVWLNEIIERFAADPRPTYLFERERVRYTLLPNSW